MTSNIPYKNTLRKKITKTFGGKNVKRIPNTGKDGRDLGWPKIGDNTSHSNLGSTRNKFVHREK